MVFYRQVRIINYMKNILYLETHGVKNKKVVKWLDYFKSISKNKNINRYQFS